MADQAPGGYLRCFLLIGGACLLLNLFSLHYIFINSKTFKLSRDTRLHTYDLQPKVQLPQRLTSSIANLTTPQKDKVKVAICSGITSKPFTTMPDKATMHLAFPIFKYFMPSFCQTYSNGYSYHFYLAYDFDDIVFNNATGRSTFTSLFFNAVNSLCLLTDSDIQLVWKECDHSGKPAWAQNDAVMEAYLDGIDYFYRVNDDTVLKSLNWTETFIATLQKFDPPNIGVVGPNFREGNTEALTYDFTYKFHQDIFGCHYPRLFPDWGADVWITKIYQPGRSIKIRKVNIRHTMSIGTRYEIHVMRQMVPFIVETYMPIFERYLDYAANDKPSINESNVMVYSLHGNDLDELNGALRNIQLAPIVYPGWRVRIYTPVQTSSHAVPQRYITKYESLGAQVLKVTLSVSSLLHLYVDAFVDPDVSVLLIRDARHRLDERQKLAVYDWLTEEKSTLHCMRDHPMHTGLVHGLYGLRLNKINETVRKQLHKQNDFENFLWKTFQDDVMCHDWTSTSIGEHKRPFPTKRDSSSYVGKLYDAYMSPVFDI